MAKAKANAKGRNSYTTVAVTVETYHRKSNSRSEYNPKRSGKKKLCH